MEIKLWKENRKTITPFDRIKKWDYETSNYQTAINKDGKENKSYFYQDIAIDAYAFAYAILKFKYGEIDYLYLPTHNKELFKKYVNDAMIKHGNKFV